jgi:hypothetical protein
MSFPASPVLNEVFIADGKAWKFDGTNWVIPKKGLPEWDEIRFKPDYFDAKVISSDAPPTNQVEGTLWWDEANKRLYIYQTNVWVETSAALREKFISIDPDVINYIEAVEAADGEPLEQDVVTSLEAFILGCKVDGIWDSISSSCIIAGARTLAGAATSLKGPATTLVTSVAFNQSNYNRKTGVNGGSTAGQGIVTNYNNNNENYLDFHLSVYVTQGLSSAVAGPSPLFQPSNTVNGVGFVMFGTTGNMSVGCTSGGATATQNITTLPNSTTGLIGSTRGIKADPSTATAITPLTHFAVRGSGTNFDVAFNAIPTMIQQMVLKSYVPGSGFPEAEPRASFYTVGSSIDLTKLDARVTKLMTKLNAVLP